MSLCINPNCQQAQQEIDQGLNLFCSGCGSPLIIHNSYRIERRLGAGGFGVTYLVSDAGTSKVLKILHNTEPKAIALFEQEARVLQRLNHVGIPKVEADSPFLYHPNGDKPLHCLVMELIEGEDLEGYMKKRNYQPISEKAAIRWLRELVEILDVVHGENYFHRDIKPPNIMIRNSGKLALIDFGTAREETQTYFQKQKGQGITGIVSVGYTPHEQANGQAQPRSDFFALGRTFVFLLTGKSPEDFTDSIKHGLKWQHEAQGYSQQFRDFLDELMRHDVGDRPKNTKEIIRELPSLEIVYQPKVSPKPNRSTRSTQATQTLPVPRQPKAFPIWSTGIVFLGCTTAIFFCFVAHAQGIMLWLWAVLGAVSMAVLLAASESLHNAAVQGAVQGAVGLPVLILGMAIVGWTVAIAGPLSVTLAMVNLEENTTTENFLLTTITCVVGGLLMGWLLYLALPI